jgi:hypothetical protein
LRLYYVRVIFQGGGGDYLRILATDKADAKEKLKGMFPDRTFNEVHIT